MPDTQPFDHNGECLICDELAGHRADCGWLLGLLVEIALLEKNAQLQAAKLVDQEQVITNQLRTIGGLRAAFDDATKEAGELAGKIQYLVNWAYANNLLADGTFTFPDGDTWEAGTSST